MHNNKGLQPNHRTEVTGGSPLLFRMREHAEMMRFMAIEGTNGLACQLLQEFLLVETVLESLASVDEYDRNFVRELTSQQFVGFDVYFTPAEASSALQFRELLLHDFAEMASFA